MIKRPAFITFFTLLVAVKVCGLLVLIFIAIFATPDSTLQINEDRILIGDARIKILVILMLWLLFSVYIGLGLWRGNSIARHLFFGSVVIVLLGATIARQSYIELPLIIAASGLIAWYLYAKPGVKLFFAA